MCMGERKLLQRFAAIPGGGTVTVDGGTRQILVTY